VELRWLVEHPFVYNVVEKLINMIKHFVLKASLFIIIILFVGCSQPINKYKKVIDEISLPYTLEEIEKLSSECADKLDDFVLEASGISEINEKLKGYDDLNRNIERLKELVSSTISSCNEININDINVMTEIHPILLRGLLKYEDIVFYLEEVARINKDMLEMLADVHELSNQVLEINYSGSLTSIAYKTALSEFVEANYEHTKLFDSEYAKEILGTYPLDEQLLSKSLKEARQMVEALKEVECFNHTDATVHSLLIETHQRMLDMVDYALNNKEIVEWSNQYKKFSDYFDVQKQTIDEDIFEWEKAIEMLELT